MDTWKEHEVDMLEKGGNEVLLIILISCSIFVPRKHTQFGITRSVRAILQKTSM